MNELYARNLKNVISESDFKERVKMISRRSKKRANVRNIILEVRKFAIV